MDAAAAPPPVRRAEPASSERAGDPKSLARRAHPAYLLGVTNAPAPGPVHAYPLGDALYLNLTSACTLACVFCPKIRDGDFTVGGFDLKLRRPGSVDEVWAAARRVGLEGRSEVVFTGFGEPTRSLPALLELTRRLKAAGVARVRVDTDGLASLREGRDVTPELRAAGVDALSVSLNAADAATYARICPSPHGEAAYEAVRDFIRKAVASIPEVAASCVALPGLSEEDCRRAAESLGARFRWRPYDRLGRIEGAPGAAASSIPPVAG